MNLSVTNDELRVIASAINWTLNVPFDRSAEPDFSHEDSERLQALFDAFVHLLWDKPSAIQGEFRQEQQTICLSADEMRLITTCIESFANEIGHSPAELEVVASVPCAVVRAAFSRFAPLE